MTFQINGNSGKYDSQIKDESVKYGKNSVSNNFKYMESPIVNDNHAIPPVFDFSPNEKSEKLNLDNMEKYLDKNDEYLKSLPPLEFEYRYMPNISQGQIDKKAVLAAAEEEMGGQKEISVEDFENKYLINDEMTVKPLDINNDNKIDSSEYATNIFAADLLIKGTTDVTKVDGTINAKGMNAILEYTKKSNAEAATNLYKNIYNYYQLGS